MMSEAEVSESPRSGRLKKRSFLSRMAEESQENSAASSRASLRKSGELGDATPRPSARLPPVDAVDELTPVPTPTGQALGDSFNHRFRNLTVFSGGSFSDDDRDSPPTPTPGAFANASLKRIRDAASLSGGSDESESEKPSSCKRQSASIDSGSPQAAGAGASRSAFHQRPARSTNSPVEHTHSSPEPSMGTRRLGRFDRLAETSIGRSASSDLLSRYSSVSCPAPLPVSRARSQGFLVGAMSGTAGAMLGAEELERVFPERRLRVYAVTWNIGCLKVTDYPSSLDQLLFPDSLDFLPDIYVVGIQEITPENSIIGKISESRQTVALRREWTLRLQATLGPNFVPYECASMGTLHLSVFLRRDLIWYVSIPENASVSTRAAIATKGAVGISFMIFGTSMLFVNCHFKSDDGNFRARVNDYHKIISQLSLPKLVVQNEHMKSSSSVTSRFDCVLWMGDLNFRIDRPRDIVDRVLASIRLGEHPNYEDLLCGDELLQARAEGTCFQEFDEGRINFAPTYKFDQKSDAYDTSGKMRIPSYTDRIMYRVRRRGSLACLEYDSLNQVKYSDHRPVYGLFEIDLKPGLDNIPLAAGSFLRDIYVEGNRRRALRLDLEALKKSSEKLNSRVCVLQ